MRIRFSTLLAQIGIACLLLFLAGCSGSGGSVSSNTPTGAVTAKVTTAPPASPVLFQQQPQGMVKKSAVSTLPGVVTVRFSLSAKDMTTLSKDFPVDDRKGTLANVPAGSGRLLIVEGLNADGAAIYRAEVSNITVTEGQTKDVGTIVMTPVQEVQAWKQTATMPGIDNIRAISFDPTNQNIVYALGSNGWLYKTTSGGASWQKFATPTPAYAIVVSPANNQILFGASYDGIYKSQDSGATWSLIPGSPVLNNYYWYGYGNQRPLVIDPGNAQKLYATSDTAVYASSDGGATWQQLSSGLSSSKIIGISIVSSNSQIMYVATRDVGIYKTVNGGATWTPINNGLPSLEIDHLAIDTTGGQYLYVTINNSTSGNYFYKSTDGGATWSSVTNYQYVTAVSPTNPQVVFGHYDAGIGKSVDGGISWNNAYSTNWIDRRGSWYWIGITISPANANLLYGFGPGGIVKSNDNGATWAPMNSGLDGWTETNAVVTDNATSGTIYAAPMASGVYISTDSGSSWTATNSGISSNDLNMTSLARSPLAGTSLLLAASNTGAIYRSSNKGASWAKVASLTTYNNYGGVSLSFDPKTPTTVYATMINYGSQDNNSVYRSTDSGSSWQPLAGILPEYEYPRSPVAVDPTNSSILYVGTYKTLYKSVNAGTTWTPLTLLTTTSADINEVAINPQNGNELYVASSYSGSGGIYKTTDGGSSWTQLNSALTYAYSVALSPLNSKNVFVYGYGNNLSSSMFVSADGGGTWTGGGYGGGGSGGFAFDPANPLVVYSAGYGVYTTTSGGK